MGADETRRCQDCDGELKDIRLIDQGFRLGTGKIEGDLQYSGAGAKPSWTGRFPMEGRIAALMCQDCGRVILFGEAN